MAAPKNSKTIDRWIVAIASLSLVTSSALLLDDKFFYRLRKLNQAPTDPIAKIIDPEKDVRRRLDGDVIWFPVQQKDSVFQDDSIFTGDASRTDVVFADKTSLSISSQSLVRISIKKGKTTLQLIQGKVRVKVGSKGNFTLVANGRSKVISGNGEAEINVPPKEEAQITSLSGKLEVQTEDQKQPQELIVKKEEPVAPQAPAPDVIKEKLVATVPDDKRRPDRSIAAEKAPVKDEGELEPEDAEQLELSTKKTPVDPTLNFSSLSFGHTFSFTKINAETTDGSRSAQLTSLLNFGVGAQWQHTWSRYWKSAFTFDYLYQEFEKINGITFSNQSSSFFKLGVEGGRQITNYWTLLAGATYGQQAFVNKISDNEVAFDRTLIPTLSLKSNFNFMPRGKQSIGLNLGANMQLSSQGDGYTTSSNLGYFSDIVVRGYWSPHTYLEGKGGYLYQSQNTSTMNQTYTEVRFSILFVFTPNGI